MIFKDFVDASAGVVHSYRSSMYGWVLQMTTWTPPGQLVALGWSLGHTNAMERPGKHSGELPGQKSQITKN